MSGNDSLKDYQQKRDFTKTTEPKPKKKKSRASPIFVIQKHEAHSLHYDFRIEVNGVLKSWAVPKGPSTDPSEKRLAMLTEDHPIDYADFEGVIPQGQYGAGTVMIWDKGIYKNRKKEKMSMQQAFDKGKIEIRLQGKKLQGGYALIRTGKEHDKKWLLIKMKDEDADARRKPVNTQNKSVISGKTMKQIRQDQ